MDGSGHAFRAFAKDVVVDLRRHAFGGGHRTHRIDEEHGDRAVLDAGRGRVRRDVRCGARWCRRLEAGATVVTETR
jgi:hypothetical protein